MHPAAEYSGHTKKLEKKKLQYLEQIARFLPNKYMDYRKETGLVHTGRIVMFGILKESRTSMSGSGVEMSRLSLTDRVTGQCLNVIWFNTGYPGRLYENYKGVMFLVCGKVTYEEKWGYQMISPDLFTDSNHFSQMILQPVYKKFKGISKGTFQSFIDKTITEKLDEPCCLQKYGIEPLNEISKKLHYPKTEKDIEEAIKQIMLTDMIYFAINMKLRETGKSGKTCIISKNQLQTKAIDSLPYELTPDQLQVVQKISRKLCAREHLNALVQGDVSCGKTVTAILMLILAAENGYQSVMLAPTLILAMQHYEDVKKMAEPLGLKVDFLGSGISSQQKKKILERLEKRETDILVGTHSVTMPDVTFQNLGLVVIDEEQRFGVERREMLKNKSINDVAYISMSATPIPRTLAMTIYGEETDIYSIHSMPSGRQSVTTTRTDNYDPPEILLNEIREGRQAYVICPLVDADEDIPCRSCKETVETYEEFFRLCGMPDVVVGCLNGQMKEKEMTKVLDDFVKGNINVLVATTVVEVGVNNPNASVIVIQDADRFGLSGLHQLRGRVRRGSYKPYCILMSKEADENPRLEAMCNTEDGFELSMMDLEIRKSGNLIGTMQSGKDRFVPLIEKYPAMYEYAKTVAADMIKQKTATEFVQYMTEIYG